MCVVTSSEIDWDENGKQLKYYELTHQFENNSLRCHWMQIIKGTQPIDPLQFKWALDMLKYGQK